MGTLWEHVGYVPPMTDNARNFHIRTGPKQPGETREEYIQRVIANAARPTDEQVARLAALLDWRRLRQLDTETETEPTDKAGA